MTTDSAFSDKSILVTGGTGSFGQAFVQHVLANYQPRRLVVFSRDEMKQFEMAQRFPEHTYPCLRYFIGDVRDRERLNRACSNVDIVIHAAAMKHISAAEYNPTECIATNIGGATNVIDAAIANDVSRVVALSTDKAANPINLYGATKLCSDKLFIAANNLAGKHATRFAIVRYGNVIGSRGSVVPLFKKLVRSGKKKLPVTDKAMTRFVITLDQGVLFVLRALSEMSGGEIFIPKLPSIRITDLVRAIAADATVEIVGIRPGEKLHEVMIPWEESRQTHDMGDYYVLAPSARWWSTAAGQTPPWHNRPVTEPFEYASNTNSWWLTADELRALVESVT